jgi:Tol biopolymer transport system component
VHVAFGRPAWSPDGLSLAFAAEVGRRTKPLDYRLTDLFVVRANGSGVRRLTHTGSASTPTWSPDGHTIVFAAATFFNHDANVFTSVATSLWRMNSNGTDLRRLTPVIQGQIDATGSFSPDGTRVAFTAHQAWNHRPRPEHERGRNRGDALRRLGFAEAGL